MGGGRRAHEDLPAGAGPPPVRTAVAGREDCTSVSGGAKTSDAFYFQPPVISSSPCINWSALMRFCSPLDANLSLF